MLPGTALGSEAWAKTSVPPRFGAGALVAAGAAVATGAAVAAGAVVTAATAGVLVADVTGVGAAPTPGATTVVGLDALGVDWQAPSTNSVELTPTRARKDRRVSLSVTVPPCYSNAYTLIPVPASPARPLEPRSTVHFDTIKQPKAAQRVAERVRSAIRAGELRDGDRLPPERQLIEQFGYSRAIVREALRMLEDEGLITLHAGRNGGAIIQHPGADRLMNAFDMLLRLQQTSQEDFYEARRLLEPLLIGLAIERATEADIAALRGCLEPPRESSDAPQNTRRFHRTLSEAAHNNVLAVIINLVMELCLRRTKTGEFEPTHLVEVHSAIIDAIEARDLETATRRTLEHLEHSETQALATPSPDTGAPSPVRRTRPRKAQ